MSHLALHCCCAPCTIEPLRELSGDYDRVTLVYANSNIHPEDEYIRRRDQFVSYAAELGADFVELPYQPADWIGAVVESAASTDAGQGVDRCAACYRLRLEEVAAWALANGADTFATTLTVSPYQHQQTIERVGVEVAADRTLAFDYRDFSALYPLATRESREMGMYRQNYCGCFLSDFEARQAREARREARRADKAAPILRTDDFDYSLPDELIAQHPMLPRDACRLMVVHRDGGQIEHRAFVDIIEYLNPGDLLVVNETRVLPARLLGRRAQTGGAVEILLLKELECASDGATSTWECLAKPGRSARPGHRMEFGPEGEQPELTCEIVSFEDDGVRKVIFTARPGDTVKAAIHRVGQMPLPPYITEPVDDPELYQTVYSHDEHSAAAPTAGLHFTRELLAAIGAKGVQTATVRLDVGLDTFRPVAEDDPANHHIHTEYYQVPQETVDAIAECRARGGRVVAVGTTATRALESAYRAGGGKLVAVGEPTSLFILPGYEFGVVDALITNFHVPRSTLMMLVSAFASRELIMAAYAEAVEQRYRMLSFGDAMLIV